MQWVLFSCFVASFLVTLVLVPKWIRKANAMGLVGADITSRRGLRYQREGA